MGEVILVTGGAGFIGSHLVDRLIREGYEVRVIDNFSTGRWENLKHVENNPNAEIIKGDLKNEQNIEEAIRGLTLYSTLLQTQKLVIVEKAYIPKWNDILSVLQSIG